MGTKRMPDIDRILGRLDRSGDCWLWTGKLNNRGYGQTTVGSTLDGTFRYALVHRFVYEQINNIDIPSGLVIDHLCSVRHCANPAHLEVVTQRENLARGNVWAYPRKGLNNPRPARRRTTCKWGHQRRSRANGKWYCPECQRLYDAKRYAEQKASAA